MEKTKTFGAAFLVVLCAFGAASPQNVGIRCGIGQFASQAEEIDGSTGNSYMLSMHVQPKGSFRIDLGVRYNGTEETELSLVPAATAFLEVQRLTRRIGYTGIYIAPGLDIDLSQVGSGLGAYAFAGGGVAFTTVVNRVDYADTATTPLYKIEEDHENWKPFWLLGGGAKIQIFYIGIFGEFAYYDGEPLKYDPITAYGIELMPGGTVKPRGFAAYVGLCWN